MSDRGRYHRASMPPRPSFATGQSAVQRNAIANVSAAQRERQQREVHAAPAQDHESPRSSARRRGDHDDREQQRQHRSGRLKPVAGAISRGRIAADAKPRAVAERHQAGGSPRSTIQPHRSHRERSPPPWPVSSVSPIADAGTIGITISGKRLPIQQRPVSLAFGPVGASFESSRCARRAGRAGGTSAPGTSARTSTPRRPRARSGS